MSDNTKIEWTDATWNPITGCTLVSDGCRNCYAATLAATRLKHHPSRAGLTRLTASGEARFTGDVRLNAQWLDQPLRWRKPRRIFVCAHGDLFHENVPDDWIDRVFAVMALAPQHTFQVLTKRPDRMLAYLGGDRFTESHATERIGYAAMALVDDATGGDETKAPHWPVDHLVISSLLHGPTPDVPGVLWPRPEVWPLPNVWLGTSVEDQGTANARIPHLLATPAAVRFVSAEPLLGPWDTRRTLDRAGMDPVWGLKQAGLDWVIVGGESGAHARPMHPDWARSLRDQCQAAGVAFHFKQWGEWVPWEMRSAPMWQAQDGKWEDGNVLFPPDMDHDPRWNDGLNEYEPGVTDHAAFERVGKRAAGRLLDGREWNEFPT